MNVHRLTIRHPTGRPPERHQAMHAEPARSIKSSHSYSNGNCVEVAAMPGAMIAVRDSKNPHGPVLTLTAGQWRAFTQGIRAGDFRHA
jgi:hypothetical protein